MRANDAFTLTEDHLQLLRCSNVGWNEIETGAATIDPKRPYGNSDVLRDLAAIFDVWVDDDGYPRNTEDIRRLQKLHKETEAALEVVLRCIPESPRLGVYVRSIDTRYAWRHSL